MRSQPDQRDEPTWNPFPNSKYLASQKSLLKCFQVTFRSPESSYLGLSFLGWTLSLPSVPLGLRGSLEVAILYATEGYIKVVWMQKLECPYACAWGPLQWGIKPDEKEKDWWETGTELTELEALNLNLTFHFHSEGILTKVGGGCIFYLLSVCLSVLLNIYMYRVWPSICILAQDPP